MFGQTDVSKKRRPRSGPEVIKLFSCSTQLSMKFFLLINLKLLTFANSFLLNIAEHENFSANKYENANYCWHFHILLAENFSCSVELSMKKHFITSRPDVAEGMKIMKKYQLLSIINYEWSFLYLHENICCRGASK